MTWERAGRLAWIAPALAVAIEVAYFSVSDYPDASDEGVEVLFLLTFVTYAAIGALIASRRPRNTTCVALPARPCSRPTCRCG